MSLPYLAAASSRGVHASSSSSSSSSLSRLRFWGALFFLPADLMGAGAACVRRHESKQRHRRVGGREGGRRWRQQGRGGEGRGGEGKGRRPRAAGCVRAAGPTARLELSSIVGLAWGYIVVRRRCGAP